MEDVFRALADPHRRVMVEALSAGEATAGELGRLVPVAQPGVSRHLSILLEAGLVAVRQDGRQRYYRLQPDRLDQVRDWLGERSRIWRQRADALHTEVARGRRQRRAEDHRGRSEKRSAG